jgi:hypothetical protein
VRDMQRQQRYTAPCDHLNACAFADRLCGLVKPALCTHATDLLRSAVTCNAQHGLVNCSSATQ